jgi:hypothetical protein
VLYKEDLINLQVVGGFFVMLCIFGNIKQLYEMVPAGMVENFSCFMIGLSK